MVKNSLRNFVACLCYNIFCSNVTLTFLKSTKINNCVPYKTSGPITVMENNQVIQNLIITSTAGITVTEQLIQMDIVGSKFRMLLFIIMEIVDLEYM